MGNYARRDYLYFNGVGVPSTNTSNRGEIMGLDNIVTVRDIERIQVAGSVETVFGEATYIQASASTNPNLTVGAWAPLPLDVVADDALSEYNNSTYITTLKHSGRYLCFTSLGFGGNGAGVARVLRLNYNSGTSYSPRDQHQYWWGWYYAQVLHWITLEAGATIMAETYVASGTQLSNMNAGWGFIIIRRLG